MPKEAKKPLTTKQTRVDLPDTEKFRNLKQYADMSDEEYEQYWEGKDGEGKILLTVSLEDFEERIKGKMDEYAEDYDLIDMKFNDRETLRALCQAQIQLEDLEQFSYEIRNSNQGITLNNLTLLDKLAQQMSRTRLDLSKLQEDLKISRKLRQTDKSLDAISELDRVKALAKQFYEEKMIYIFCPKCNQLLSTNWILFSDADNIMRLECKRVLGDRDGEICGNVFDVHFKDLVQKGSNKPEIMPESLR